MMFDTLKYVETLIAAGVPKEQARAMATAQLQVFSEALDHTLATKTDIFALKSDIVSVRAELVEVKTELKDDIAQVKSEVHIMKWMLGFIFTGIVALILKGFF